jgi:hypothetical protein
VVSGVCTQTSSQATVNYISKNGQLSLVINAQNASSASSNSFGGWEVYNSTPGMNPGNTAPTSTTFGPPGTYGFTVSGLPSSGASVTVSVLDQSRDVTAASFSITNGQVTCSPPAVSDVGQSAVAVYFTISTPNGFTTPVTVSNFTLNGAPLLIDTSHFDANIGTQYTWCNGFEFPL